MPPDGGAGPTGAALELEQPGGPGGESDGLPFAELADYSWVSDTGAARTTSAQGGWVAQLRARVRYHLHVAHDWALFILQLLTCNTLSNLASYPSARNVLFMGVSATVFASVWFWMEPLLAAWTLGVLMLIAAMTRLVWVDPFHIAALALMLQYAYSASTDVGRRALWYIMGVILLCAEACWWPSFRYLIEHDVHSWMAHFSTYYVVIVEFWVFPCLLQVDPEELSIVKEVESAPAETKAAVVHAGVGIAILVALPLLGCALLSLYILWRQSPRLCLSISVVYCSLIILLLTFQDMEPARAIQCGQVCLGMIFIMLVRMQFISFFGDHRTWKIQSFLLATLFFVQQLVAARLDQELLLHTQAISVLAFHLLSKQCLSAQCSAVRLGLPSVFRPVVWLPRRSSVLFDSEEAHDSRIVLQR